MAVKLDKVVMSTLHESYKNYKVSTVSIDISGDAPVGGTSYTQVVPFDRANTRCDIYYYSYRVAPSLDLKIRANESTIMTGWLYDGTNHTPNTVIKYGTDSVEVGVYVFNSGGAPDPMETQTITFVIVQFEAPISAL